MSRAATAPASPERDPITAAQDALAALEKSRTDIHAELERLARREATDAQALAQWKRACIETDGDPPAPPPQTHGLAFRRENLERRARDADESIAVARGQLRAARLAGLQDLRASFLKDFDRAVNELRDATVKALAVDILLQGYGVRSAIAPGAYTLGVITIDAHSMRPHDDLMRVFSVEGELARGAVTTAQTKLRLDHPEFFPER